MFQSTCEFAVFVLMMGAAILGFLISWILRNQRIFTLVSLNQRQWVAYQDLREQTDELKSFTNTLQSEKSYLNQKMDRLSQEFLNIRSILSGNVGFRSLPTQPPSVLSETQVTLLHELSSLKVKQEALANDLDFTQRRFQELKKSYVELAEAIVQ